jgi:uncharacterized protein (DUF2236 family)
MIALARAGGLQGSHPTNAAGLEQHSTGAADPFRRLRNTIGYAVKAFYGNDQPGTAAEIRELHRDIKGVRDDGRRYHAWNGDAWAWVHLTTIEALLYAMETLFGSLPPEQVDGFYQESRRMGMLYGVREEDMPEDVAGLRAYVEDGIQTKLSLSPATQRIRALTESLSIGPVAGAPTSIRRALYRVVSPPLNILLYGSFPPAVRRLWGIRWTGRQRAAHRALVAALRAMSVLPDRWRMIPAAYAAMNQSVSIRPGTALPRGISPGEQAWP